MKKTLTFKKLAGRWFIDIPYNGNIGDLEMVLGADEIVERISESGYGDVVITVTDEECYVPECYDLYEDVEHDAIMVKDYETINEMSEGHYYMYNEKSHLINPLCDKIIWLCDVTKLIFDGEFPEKLYVFYK